MKNFIKTVLFLALIVGTYFLIIPYFGVSNIYSEHSEMMIKGYYETKENTTDVVVIGNSHVYRYWQPSFAWKECGIASSSISTSDMPPSTIKNVCIEALKSQSPKVLIIDATAFFTQDDEPNNKMYLLTNNMKYSKNYIDLINNFCKYSDVEGSDKIQYYLSMGQFHTRWNDINRGDFELLTPSLLNSCYQEDFLTTAIDGPDHVETEERLGTTQGSEDALADLLTWCQEQKDVTIVFTSAPCLMSEARFASLNHIGDVIKSYGFEYLDFNTKDWYYKFGFDEKEDFQDENHVNIRGSYKYNKVFGEYLKETYGIADHSGEDAYSEWDEKAQEYYDIVMPYVNGTVRYKKIYPVESE